MDMREDGSRKPAAYTRQSSFDFRHYNLCPTSTDEDTIKASGVNPNEVVWWTSKRFCLSILCFVGFACVQMQMLNLSIAMPCVVKRYANTSSDSTVTTQQPVWTGSHSNGSSHTYTIGDDDTKQCEVSDSKVEEFSWSKPLQGLLLGAYFWGYLVLQIPGFRLSERFGAKKVIAAGMLPAAILTIMSPLAARTSPYLLFAMRIVIGLGQGVVYSASQTLWAEWFPPWERSKLTALALSGGQLGTVLVFPLGGSLCSSDYDGGWPLMFYIIGSLSVVWWICWVLFAHESPNTTPSISDRENKYITHSLQERGRPSKPRPTPWRSILPSGSVWTLIIAHVCGNYGLYMLMTLIPTYMKEVLKFEPQSYGLYSMLLFACRWICIGLAGFLANFFIFRDVLSVTWTRKVLTIMGLAGPAFCLIALPYIDCNQSAAAVIVLCVALGLSGCQYPGYFINHGDIAPAYAGTLFGVTNTAASLTGILAPYFTSTITYSGSRSEWQTAFHLCSGLYIFGALVFLVFGTGNIRYWARVSSKPKDDGLSVRRPIVNGNRKSQCSVRNTYLDNEESNITVEYEPGESYALSASV